MDDNFNDKIIDIHKKINTSDLNSQNNVFNGVEYIKITKDENGLPFKADSIIEYAKRTFYIITVVKNQGIASALYKYKVPYDDVLNFLNEFRNNSSHGIVIDIERYLPDDLA